MTDGVMPWSQLRENADRAGVGPIVESLLACSWGRSIHTPDDAARCPEQATRMMVIHAPPDVHPPAITFRFCDWHFARAEAATVVHGGAIEERW